jgi:diguanylate cyclase (GGDEF)-like protein
VRIRVSARPTPMLAAVRTHRGHSLTPLTAELSARTRRAVDLGALILVAAVALLAMNNLGLLGGASFGERLDNWVYNGAEVGAAALVLARAVLVRAEHRAWLMLALGMGFFAAGDIYFTFVIEPMASPPSPSLADAGYLSFYVCAYAMIVLLVRTHVRRFHAGVWLDGAIGALATAALGAAVVLEPVLRQTHGSLAVVATNLAYPLADLLLVAFVVGVFALTGWRPGRTWMLIGLGFATLAIADSIYLFQEAEHTYTGGTILDAIWPAGLVLLTFAAWSTPRERAAVRFEGLAILAVPCAFALMALFLLIRSNYVHLGVVAEALATAAMLAAGARFALTFNEVRKLSEIRDRQARTDDLTGLANRRHFYTLLEQAVAANHARGQGFALLIIDLNHFKEVNDTLGHRSGDLLLQQIGPRLQSVVREDSIARLGGDEFGLIVRDRAAAELVAERINETLLKPFKLDDLGVSVRASIGIAVYPRDASSIAKLLQRADVAMYQAKAAHSRHTFYTAGSDRSSREHLELAAQLPDAIAKEQLVVYYQPQVDLLSGRCRGVEALVRWQHPEHGLLGPDRFIAIAEQAGLMHELTASVLEQSLRQQQSWLREGHELTLAVNVSATNFMDASFLPDLRRRLHRCQTLPHTLRLEITESVLVAEGLRVRAAIDSLAELCVGLSLDDFGTGYSALAYLRDLPVMELKIDRSFIEAMMTDKDTATIVASTIALARNLHIDLVAEGVERIEQIELLRSYDCPVVQGYYFSPPLPADGLHALLERETGRALLGRLAAGAVPRESGRGAHIELT